LKIPIGAIHGDLVQGRLYTAPVPVLIVAQTQVSFELRYARIDPIGNLAGARRVTIPLRDCRCRG
jgi:hypothetical protein